MNRRLVQQGAWMASIVLLGGASILRADEVVGGDVVYSDIGGIQDYGSVGGVHGFALGSHTCNRGNQDLIWANGSTPGLGMNVYRLYDGRLMQIGLSWVKTACCAAAGNGCGLACNGHGGNVLGAGCRDVYTAGWNGSQTRLGPRSGINAFTGIFQPIPPGSGNAIFRRLQINNTDLMSANFPGALYFAEGVYVGTDDAQFGNAMNNASYKRVEITGTLGLGETGSMNVSIPAINAWHDHGNGVNSPDDSVEIGNLDVPSEGRFILAAKVSQNGGGTWRYDYAVYNLNSDRSGGSFSVPIPAGTTVSNIGFHDVDYHSGEPYDNTDWTGVFNGSSVRWTSPQTFEQNPNSNALRWGTLYNFWFDANTPPVAGTITLGLFKPHAPSSITGPAKVPSNACAPPQFVGAESGVSFGNRAFDNFIDARSESTDGVNVNLGLSSFNIEFTTPVENIDGTPLSAAAFTITDSTGGAPGVQSVESEDSQHVTVVLNRHIDLQQWTEIGVHARARCNASLVMQDSIAIGYLPGDVNQSAIVDALDLLKFKQYANNLAVPVVGVPADYTDMDRDGHLGPVDLLRFKQLVNGISPPATRNWSGQSLP